MTVAEKSFNNSIDNNNEKTDLSQRKFRISGLRFNIVNYIIKSVDR